MPEDRDVLRPKPTPASVRAQSAAPEAEVDEDFTGKYEGEELAERRARRPTPERLSHLEQKNDEQDKRHEELAKVVNATAITVAHIEGQMEGQNRLLDRILVEVQSNNQHEHARFIGMIDVDTAKQKAQIDDSTDAKKSRRKLLYQLAGLLVGLLLSSELLHWLLGKL